MSSASLLIDVCTLSGGAETGLSGTGKTTVLSSLCGEENSNPEPTNGFAIKAAQLDQVIFNVKELGGSDKFRPYWDKYYNAEVDGLVRLALSQRHYNGTARRFKHWETQCCLCVGVYTGCNSRSISH